jgi:hypothetical protein
VLAGGGAAEVVVQVEGRALVRGVGVAGAADAAVEATGGCGEGGGGEDVARGPGV